MYAPYTSGMRLGQGYNSYLQETCLENAVEICELIRYGQTKPDPDTGTASHGVDNKIHWALSDDRRPLENFKNLVDWQGISPAAIMKNGLQSSGAAVSYMDENRKGVAILDVRVSIKQQPRIAHVEFKFNGLSSDGPQDRAIYGDCFISGFIEGVEFIGIKKNREKTPGDIRTDGQEGGVTENSSHILTRSVSTVSVKFNGAGIEDINPWTLEDLHRAAATFRDQARQSPHRTFAILTPYKNIRNFHESKTDLVPLDYSKITLETDLMFTAYLRYVKLKLDLAARIKDELNLSGGDKTLEKTLGEIDDQLELICKNVNEAAVNPDGGVRKHKYTDPFTFEKKIQYEQPPADMRVDQPSTDVFVDQLPVDIYVDQPPTDVFIDQLPVDIYVGQHIYLPYRSMVGFYPIDASGWNPRCCFKAFKNPAPKTIKISVGFLPNPQRAMVFSEDRASIISEGWDLKLQFWAYQTEQPDTEQISVLVASSPRRCLVDRQKAFDSVVSMRNWSHRLKFWAPL